MSTEESNTTHISNEQDLWSFIKNNRATHTASLKVLQKFVLSLNRDELTHLIEIYLKSKLHTYSSPSNPPTFKSSAIKLSQNDNNKLNKIDESILHKMNKKYGKKMSKKMISQIQQKRENTKNNNLLRIYPQVLAYTFQFLSFKELCKIQHTCVYFTYLCKKYSGLTRYYININKKFCLSAMRNKIDLNSLSQFKYIKLSHCYYLDNRLKWKSQLFKHILKVIINQSKSCLDILSLHRSYYTNSALFFIINEVNGLSVTKLVWNGFARTTNQQHSSNEIRSILHTKMSSLQHISGNLSIEILPMIKHYNRLQSLELDFDSTNPFSMNIIKLITTNISNLKKLSISVSLSDEFNTVYTSNDCSYYAGLEELNISTNYYRWPNPDIQEVKTKSNFIVSKLLLTFIGIKKFIFKSRTWTTFAIESVIDWKQYFSTLMRNKSLYLMHNSNRSINDLESLAFLGGGYKSCKHIMNELMDLNNEIFFNLKEFEIEGDFETNYNSLIEDYLIPFVNKNKNLKHIKIHSTDYMSFSDANNIGVVMKVLLKLLSNISKSVKLMDIKLPCFWSTPRTRIYKNEIMNVVKKLCQLLADKNGECNLETIIFQNFNLCKQAKEFLTFVFGFNNKFWNKNNKYHLTFI